MITKAAKKYMEKHGIRDVTFKLVHYNPVGCCIGIVKEIEAYPGAPDNACHYKYLQADGYHVFISRAIRILGPLSLTMHGFWRFKRLGLEGAGIPL
jgi:hypothetical protein